ncbi:MAG: TIGR03000 domain-containing protein [Thermoguttaceae bacterium]|nr:TIGR03000 domain-containing protein [Thermoguttaceae bacterium]
MKIIGLTLRASLAAALLTVAPSAFAFGGLFDGGLFKSAEPEYVVDDGSFFAGEALTIGEMAAPSPFFSSAASESYSGCASCGDDSGVVYGGGVPAAIDCCDPCAFVCDPCEPYVVWGGYRSSYVPGQPVRNVLRGVRNLLSNCSLFCQPAYVCDPCWTVCDPCWSPCDPCWTSCEATCDGGYAPRCCGDGMIPGEARPMDANTGLPQAGGVDAVSPTPTLQTDSQPLGSYQETTPAVPQVAPAPQLNAPAAAPETIPTPEPANLGAGVLNMLVPEDAVVYVNGYRTKQTGAVRSFAAKSLEFGETYSFEIRVVAVRDGQVFEDVQHATLTAGQETALAFNLSLRSNQAVAAR